MVAYVTIDGSYRDVGGKMKGQTGWTCLIRGNGGWVTAQSMNLAKTKINSARKAEWIALTDALKWVRVLTGLTKVVVRTDLKEIADVFRTNGKGKDSLAGCKLGEAAALLPGVELVVKWIPRRENWPADLRTRYEPARRN